jgi:secreted trypsin-like serine protease
MRRSLIPVVAALAALLVTTPASAITGGRPDTDGHPYVALMQTYDQNRKPLQVCTGSLVTPTLFLTAAHCVEEPHAVHAEVWFDQGPIIPDIDYLLALFLDPNFDGSCNYSPNFDGYPCFGDAGGTPHAHPDFCFGCHTGVPRAVVGDVAVVTLDAPVPAATVSRYARLPSANLVDTLANRTPVDFAGFGVQEQLKLPGNVTPAPPPRSRWTGAGTRMTATAKLVAGSFAQSDGFIRFTLNEGGICFGDSGGPALLGGTDTVMAVNSYVSNGNCAGVAYSQRVDTPEVLAWIRGFMD